jgi:hypothetical protein
MIENSTLTKLTLPEDYKSRLDIRTLYYPKFEVSTLSPESDLHIVSTQPFDSTVSRILKQRGFAFNDVESTLIPTKAVASINYAKNSRSQGYRDFQECLLEKGLFGESNGFEGYMEYEGWTPEIIVNWKDYNNPNNVELELPQLDPKKVIDNNFKRGDLHLVVSKIDIRLEQKLFDLGFYYADFTNKENSKDDISKVKTGLHRAFTIQNTEIRNTNKIKQVLQNYILDFGGVEGKIFIEPVLLYVRTRQNSVPPCSGVRVR